MCTQAPAASARTMARLTASTSTIGGRESWWASASFRPSACIRARPASSSVSLSACTPSMSPVGARWVSAASRRSSSTPGKLGSELHMNAFSPAAPRAICSSICSAVVAWTTPPQRAKSTTASGSASARLRSKVAPSTVGRPRLRHLDDGGDTARGRAAAARLEALVLVGVGIEQVGIVLDEVGMRVDHARKDDEAGRVDQLRARAVGGAGRGQLGDGAVRDDDVDPPGPGRGHDLAPVNDDPGLAACHVPLRRRHWSRCGERTSWRPSPTRFAASTAMKIASPGNVTYHHWVR